MSKTPPSRAASVSPKAQLSAVVPDAVPTGATDMSSLLSTYAFPLGALALCGAGALYLTKRMGDLENSVGAIKRDAVRNLSEHDVRMIVQQMQKDGLIRVQQWETQPAVVAPQPPPPVREEVRAVVEPKHEEAEATPWVPKSKRQ